MTLNCKVEVLWIVALASASGVSLLMATTGAAQASAIGPSASRTSIVAMKDEGPPPPPVSELPPAPEPPPPPVPEPPPAPEPTPAPNRPSTPDRSPARPDHGSDRDSPAHSRSGSDGHGSHGGGHHK